VILTVLPGFTAPSVAWSTFLYAALLLVIVLAMPGGIAELLDFENRKSLESNRAIVPRPALLSRILGDSRPNSPVTLRGMTLSFASARYE
jgi:branched-chain amino acid transport system permease protein